MFKVNNKVKNAALTAVFFAMLPGMSTKAMQQDQSPNEKLRIAIMDNNLKAAKIALTDGAKLDLEHSFMINCYIFNKDFDFFKLLVKKGVLDINAHSNYGNTALNMAITKDLSKNLVQWLIEHGADITTAGTSTDPKITAYLKMVTDFYQVSKGAMTFNQFVLTHLTSNDQNARVQDILPLLHLGSKNFADHLYTWLKENDLLAQADKPSIDFPRENITKFISWYMEHETWRKEVDSKMQPGISYRVEADEKEGYILQPKKSNLFLHVSKLETGVKWLYVKILKDARNSCARRHKWLNICFENYADKNGKFEQAVDLYVKKVVTDPRELQRIHKSKNMLIQRKNLGTLIVPNINKLPKLVVTTTTSNAASRKFVDIKLKIAK